jgi:hypothetical protein
MKKVLLVVLISGLLSACGTTKLADIDPLSKDAVKYTQEFGKVEVTFTDKGDWETLKSTATASIPLSDTAALEQAMNLATMRAKRNIVEFMQTDLQSSKAAETVTNALAKDVSADDNKTRERAGNIVTKLQEKITVQSDGIIRGAYISDRKISSDKTMVVVTLQVDKRSVVAAAKIRNSFAQSQ